VLPYLEIAPLHIAEGFVVQPFGAATVLGICAAAIYCAVRARQRGILVAHALNAMWWTAASGFVSAHVAAVVFYQPERLAEHGLSAFLDTSTGFSSIGGFAGGAVGLWLWVWYHREAALLFADLIVESLVVFQFFGRLGCSLVHDHPGARTDFPLAVAFPEGARHDLGLYEFAITLLVLLPLILVLDRRRVAAGLTAAAVFVVYAPVRFGLDFLRVPYADGGDVRYFGLTAAQYACPLLLLAGVWIWRAVTQGLGKRSLTAGGDTDA